MDTMPVQEWRFKPRTPLILILIAIPLAIASSLVWHAFPLDEHLGNITLLPLAALFGFVGLMGLKLWWVSWQNTRGGKEFIRLDDDGLSYQIYANGQMFSGFIRYEWLRVVSLGRKGESVILEYRTPQTGLLLECDVLVELHRLDLRYLGWRYWFVLIDPNLMVYRAIKARCADGQLLKV